MRSIRSLTIRVQSTHLKTIGFIMFANNQIALELKLLDSEAKKMYRPVQEEIDSFLSRLSTFGDILSKSRKLRGELAQLGYFKVPQPAKPWWKTNPWAPQEGQLVIGDDLCRFTVTVWF